MDAYKAKQLALDLMRDHGLLDAGWRFDWSRGKRQLGIAERRQKRGEQGGEEKVIKLSYHLVTLNGEDEVRETILHEIAHAIAGLEHGHDAKWKKVCRRIGARPERLAGERVVMPAARYTILCGNCDRNLGRRHRRPGIKQLKQLYCAYCGPTSQGALRLHDRALEGPLA